MPPPNDPRVCKVALIFARDTRQAINTFHVERAAGWTLGDMQALATAVETWYNSAYKPALPNNIALTQIQVRLLDPTNPLAVDRPVSPPAPGTRVGVMEAANVSVTMSERTGLAGRKYRGRMYVPAILEGDVSTVDTITSVLLALLSTAIGNLVFGSLPAGDLLTIFHRLTNNHTTVNTYVLENIIDSQRRRLPGRGR